MQIRVQKRWLIKMYSTEDFIMEPEGLEMRLKGVKALIQVQKQIASPPNPSNAPPRLPFNPASTVYKLPSRACC